MGGHSMAVQLQRDSCQRGRKNYLFTGSHSLSRFIGKAAQRIAMMYTFPGTCAANDVNPFEWLKTTLEKIPSTKLPEIGRAHV